MRPHKVPEDMVPVVRTHKSEIVEHLRHRSAVGERRPCKACLCDDANGGGAPCGACNGRTCRNCGNCLRASRLWRYAERYTKYLDTSLDMVLSRLQKGSEWLTVELLRGSDGTELYLGMFTTWAELEEVLRGIYGFVGCIFGAGHSCPEDAPVTCSACVSKCGNSGK